jgi:hypothetical protein
VKRVEDVLGLRKETARPSSKELHNRLVAIVAALQQSAKSEQQIGEQTGQLTKFRQKLEDADLDELWKKHRGEDQKELLRMSNSVRYGPLFSFAHLLYMAIQRRSWGRMRRSVLQSARRFSTSGNN